MLELWKNHWFVFQERGKLNTYSLFLKVGWWSTEFYQIRFVKILPLELYIGTYKQMSQFDYSEIIVVVKIEEMQSCKQTAS